MVDLFDLTLQNPWWKNPELIKEDEAIKESYSKTNKVIYHFEDEQNYIIFGPRQVGKTTFLKQLIYDLINRVGVNARNILYFSCEPLNEKNDLIEVVKLFSQMAGGDKLFLFFDEITQIEGWEYALKYFIESYSKNIFYVSGSNARFLKRGYERLPGRNIRIKLFHPLSFRKYLLHFGSAQLVDELKKWSVSGIKFYPEIGFFADEIYEHFNTYLRTGGFLRPIYEYHEKGRVSEETKRIYINWALGDIGKAERSVHYFKQIIRGIAEKYGGSFSLNSIAKESDIGSHKTIGSYLELMEEFMLIKQIFNVDLNTLSPVYRKERKVYFIDPFLAHTFYEWSTGRPLPDEKIPAVVEGVVFEHLARLGEYMDSTNYLWFYRSKKKKEVDFVFRDGKEGKIYGIEVKWQNKVNRTDFSEPALFPERLILSKKDLDMENRIIPLPLFLALLDV